MTRHIRERFLEDPEHCGRDQLRQRINIRIDVDADLDAGLLHECARMPFHGSSQAQFVQHTRTQLCCDMAHGPYRFINVAAQENELVVKLAIISF